MLGDAGQAVGLLPDVGDEVPQSLPVHLLALKDGVGQQADGGQRGLELMGGVGDKAAADLLGGLKAVSVLIELLCQVGQFVLPRRLKAVAVLPLAHHPDGPKQRPDPGGEHLGKEGAHRQGNYRQHQGDGAQVLLEIHQKSALSLVPVTHIDSANGHITVHNGRGGSGEEGALFIGGVKDIIALEGQYHLLKEGVLVLGGGWLLRRIPVLLLILLGQTVVQQQTGGIGD